MAASLRVATFYELPGILVRLRASEFVFDRAIMGVELDDIEARLAELEQAAEASKK
jgi:hypothetical protein